VQITGLSGDGNKERTSARCESERSHAAAGDHALVIGSSAGSAAHCA
jgi:hypothetical protein